MTGSFGRVDMPGRGAGWGPLRRLAAAGTMVAVAVCLSWIPVRGLTLGAAGPQDGHAAGSVFRLLAGPGSGEIRWGGVAVRAGLRLHGAFAAPGIPCLPELCARQRLLASGLPHRRGDRDLRLLAFRHRMAEEPAWSRRGGCLAERGSRLAPRLSVVVTGRTKPGADSAVPADPGRSRGMFSRPPGLTCLAAGADGPPGGAGRGIAGRWCGAFSGSGQVGCGDRATLPGRSPRYHLFQLGCGQCGTEMALLFYDQGDLPLCASCLEGRGEAWQ